MRRSPLSPENRRSVTRNDSKRFWCVIGDGAPCLHRLSGLGQLCPPLYHCFTCKPFLSSTMKSHLHREEGRKPTNLGGLRCEPLAWESSLIHNKSANPATPPPHQPSPGDALEPSKLILK